MRVEVGNMCTAIAAAIADFLQNYVTFVEFPKLNP